MKWLIGIGAITVILLSVGDSIAKAGDQVRQKPQQPQQQQQTQQRQTEQQYQYHSKPQQRPQPQQQQKLYTINQNGSGSGSNPAGTQPGSTWRNINSGIRF